jgi:GH25 family lysozyme M1 (1,4-beta-N-acetylmuramidase)
VTYFTRNQGYPFGIDISQHNASYDGKRMPDFDLIQAHEPKVRFIAMRTGLSWGYRDTLFERYFSEAWRIGVCVLPYHVLYPGEDAVRQMDFFLTILKEVDLDQVRLALDLELDHGRSKAQITRMLNECLRYLKSRTGRYPIVYSRALWINEFLEVEDLPKLDWWLAQYIRSYESPEFTPEYPCPPMLPRGVRQWLIHQTSQRAPAIGGLGHYMDYNRWNGSLEQLWAYFGRNKPRLAACPLDSFPCERAGLVWQEEAVMQEVAA